MKIVAGRPLYRWRKMTEEQRQAVLKFRKQYCKPWHSPPHYEGDSSLYLITAACFEHHPHIGHSAERMADFELQLLDLLRGDRTQAEACTPTADHQAKACTPTADHQAKACTPTVGVQPLGCLPRLAETIYAWVVLPNHYHALVWTRDVKQLLRSIGQLHGRTSYAWNGEENSRGRQVWFNAAETAMKSERHFWATWNYVLNNAAHHGYVERWQDWPFSSATEYLEEVGRDEAERRWREYPVLDYGKDWDPQTL